jgi:hypothetical protein
MLHRSDTAWQSAHRLDIPIQPRVDAYDHHFTINAFFTDNYLITVSASRFLPASGQRMSSISPISGTYG